MNNSFLAHRAFLLRRLIRYTLAETFYVCGNLTPRRVAPLFWQLALALNPHHIAAALNRARALQAMNDAKAWRAFQVALRAIENPQHTSASDLALTWVPGRSLRRIAQLILWCDTPRGAAVTSFAWMKTMALGQRCARISMSVDTNVGGRRK